MQVKDIMVEPISIDKADTISHALDVMTIILSAYLQ